MANEIAGYKGVILFSTSTSGSLSDLASLTNFSINVQRSVIDVTTHESSGTRDVVGGVLQWAGSAETLHVTSNATHKAAYDLLVGNTRALTEFYPTGSSSDGYWTGSMHITGWDLSSPNADANAANVSFEGTGALTRSSSST